MKAKGTCCVLLCAFVFVVMTGTGCTTSSDSHSPDPAQSSTENTASIVASLENILGEVEDLRFEHSADDTSTPHTYARATASVIISFESLENTRSLDLAAFTLLDILQESAPETASLRVDIHAIRPEDSTARADNWMTGRMYTWDPYIEYPFAEPEGRDGFITVWNSSRAIPSEFACGISGTAEPIGLFRNISTQSVTNAANGDLPTPVPYARMPAEYEQRPNGLGFGFGLPKELSEYRVGVEYTASCTLGYSGTDGRGRPLYDLTLNLPYGVPLEFVVKDVESGAETVSRVEEGPPVEMVLEPRTGLAQSLPFSFPQAGRYEVFLRIAGNGNPARTKGVWIDVPES